ncbi:MAG: alpha/beta hydrolase [Candidatus Saccharibacteria bacterium]|nr:alpha/beta hydrolase [Candidatus Saccharibacteria bacterium]
MTLYIIHGWTYTVEPWAKTLKILKEEYNIDTVMLNVPGLTSPSEKVWTIEEYAAWADKNLPDGAIALGHSNGGRILLNLLSKNPKKLSFLILLDAAGVYEKSFKRGLSKFLSRIFSPLKKIGPLRKVYHKLIGAEDYAHAPENMKKTLANVLASDKNLKIDHIPTKTAILWGRQDKITPPHLAEVMHEKLKNSTLKFYENWRHAPYIDDSAGLARAIATALKSTETPAKKTKPKGRA